MSRPSGVVSWALLAVMPRDERDAILGDLVEDLTARQAAGRGPRWPGFWIESRAWRFLLATLLHRRPLETLRADVNVGLRRLIREPGFAAAAIITLALSTGPSIAVVSVANWFYLRPMPGVVRQDRLFGANFGTPNHQGGYRVSRVSYHHLDDLVSTAPAVAGMAGWQPAEGAVSDGIATPRVVPIEFVSWNFFDVLGVRMQQGRPFRRDEDRSPTDPVVAIISPDLARSLVGEENPIGHRFGVNGHEVAVIGVAPPGFLGNRLLRQTALWLPGMMSRRMNNFSPEEWGYPPDTGPFYMHVGRLAGGATFERANAELTAGAARMTRIDPNAWKFETVRANLERKYFTAPPQFRPVVGLLLGIGVVLVLLGVANLANLFIFRAVRRRHESAVRRSLGASTGRVLQLHFVEAVIIAAIGCGLGFALATILKELLNGVLLPLPAGSPGIDVPLDWRIFAVTVLLSFLVAGLLASVPARMACRAPLVPAIAAVSRTATAGGRRIRTGLAVVQLMLSLTLLVGALLFTSSLRNVRDIDIGFDPDRVSVFRFGFRTQSGYDPDRIAAFLRGVLGQLGQTPGVTAAIANGTPLFGGGVHRRVAAAGRDPDTNGVELLTTHVSSDFFEVLRMRVLSGRTFAGTDSSAPGAETVLISRSLAIQLFETTHAAGRVLSFSDHHATVTGVVEDIPFDEVTGEASHVVYRPLGTGPRASLNDLLLVRSADGVDIATTVRQAIAAVDSGIPITLESSMDEALARELGPYRIFAWGSTLLAALGFLLAAVGVYGLLSQAAAERTREFGIRLALGADRGRIRWLVIRSALIVLAIGTPLGLAMAAAASRLVESQLFGVAETALVVYVLAPSALATVVLLSGALPAWAASRANPADVMRVE